MSSDIVCTWSRSEPLLSTTLYFGQTCRTMVLDQKHPHGYSLWLLAAYDDVKMLIDRAQGREYEQCIGMVRPHDRSIVETGPPREPRTDASWNELKLKSRELISVGSRAG
ncbi:hypothetical protein F2Q69_00028588 [Brassica cretica]|uniref:Uncharacterized protein n=1 Tax=Brassica cretica TaxID=69181 RepID=A0A8S9S6U1_BRACR|nr:hypothetical protein F2Q69_00028588 [Brassica cretica]